MVVVGTLMLPMVNKLLNKVFIEAETFSLGLNFLINTVSIFIFGYIFYFRTCVFYSNSIKCPLWRTSLDAYRILTSSMGFSHGTIR